MFQSFYNFHLITQVALKIGHWGWVAWVQRRLERLGGCKMLWEIVLGLARLWEAVIGKVGETGSSQIENNEGVYGKITIHKIPILWLIVVAVSKSCRRPCVEIWQRWNNVFTFKNNNLIVSLDLSLFSNYS